LKASKGLLIGLFTDTGMYRNSQLPHLLSSFPNFCVMPSFFSGAGGGGGGTYCVG